MDVSVKTPAEMVSVVKRVIEVPQDVVGGSKVMKFQYRPRREITKKNFSWGRGASRKSKSF